MRYNLKLTNNQVIRLLSVLNEGAEILVDLNGDDDPWKEREFVARIRENLNQQRLKKGYSQDLEENEADKQAASAVQAEASLTLQHGNADDSPEGIETYKQAKLAGLW